MAHLRHSVWDGKFSDSRHMRVIEFNQTRESIRLKQIKARKRLQPMPNFRFLGYRISRDVHTYRRRMSVRGVSQPTATVMLRIRRRLDATSKLRSIDPSRGPGQRKQTLPGHERNGTKNPNRVRQMIIDLYVMLIV